MRIAFFGGSFDPPHRGHRTIAAAAADRLALDQVLIAPVGSQPLKNSLSLAPFADRLAMVGLAFSADRRFHVSTLDAHLTDCNHNYTYDTLHTLSRELPQQAPDPRLFCLVGADSFTTLAHWHRAADHILMCDFIVAARPGFALTQVEQHLPPGITITAQKSHSDLVELTLTGNAKQQQRSSLFVLPDLAEDVSATELRTSLLAGNFARAATMLAPDVLAYIRNHHLYTQAIAAPQG